MTQAQNQYLDSDDSDSLALNPDAMTADVVREKFVDARNPGFEAELSPDEAAMAGAFSEDALSEDDARESAQG